MLQLRLIQVDLEIFKIFQGAQLKQVALQVANYLTQNLCESTVYSQEQLKLKHKHDKFNRNFLYISFIKTEQYDMSNIIIYRMSDFKVIKEIYIQFDYIKYSWQPKLTLCKTQSKIVQSNDLETKNMFGIERYSDEGICLSNKNWNLISNIRQKNRGYLYESMNQAKKLMVLSSSNIKFKKVRFIKLIKYDEKNINKIVKTSRLLHKLKSKKYDYIQTKICKNSQFIVIYLYNSTELIKGNKIVRKYQCQNKLKFIPVRYPQRIMPLNISKIIYL